ncbi:MAG: hypothetical protein D4R81_09880 [Nitrospiraceae bacterium]|nr:MAG: hypothetical protein D4R81_09880 [Nitrospiraceae bacterium]
MVGGAKGLRRCWLRGCLYDRSEETAMILTAHQPSYLPWLGLLHKIALSDIFCLFDDVQYLKKEWDNRNQIKTANGVIWLSVPVLNKQHYQIKCKDVQINQSLSWQKKHWRSLVGAYQKAPFFNRYADFFEDVYSRDWTHLSLLDEHIMKYLLDVFGIKVKWVRASDYEFHGKGSDLVLDMCLQLKADTYVFGTLGRDYAKIEDFAREGVAVYFQDYRHPSYSQLWGEFVSHLSAVDLLFNHGPVSGEILMEGNLTKADLCAVTERRPSGEILKSGAA